MSSPAPAPLSFVEMDLKTYMKLLFDGMVAEEIQPMRDQLSKLSQAVLGKRHSTARDPDRRCGEKKD